MLWRLILRMRFRSRRRCRRFCRIWRWRRRVLGSPRADHDQHGDRGMEYRGSGETAGLVRGGRVCVCGAIGADGEDAESEAAAESEVSGAGGYDYRAAAQRSKQPINGTPRTIETLLRFREFQCYPTMFPRVYPNGDVFYPCEPLRKVAGNLLRDGSLAEDILRGGRRCMEIFRLARGFAICLGMFCRITT